MDIKEIALKLQATDRFRLNVSELSAIEFAEALIYAYKVELLSEAGGPVAWIRPKDIGCESAVVSDVKPFADWKPLFTSEQLTAAIAKATKPLEDQLAAAREEIERLKGTKDVQLDIHSNNARTNQQRELDGPLEMGQLLADSKNEETGDPKAERTKSLVWMHTGDGHIADSSGKRIGIFSGDFKHRDRLICAVNSESDLLAQLAAAQEEIAFQKSAHEQAQQLLLEQGDQLAKAEQQVAEACADLLVDRFKHEVAGTLAIRQGEWRKFVKEV